MSTVALVFILFFCTSGGPYTTETSITVNGNDDSFPSTRHRKDVMAAVNARQKPTALLKNAGKVATGDLLHTATAMI